MTVVTLVVMKEVYSTTSVEKDAVCSPFDEFFPGDRISDVNPKIKAMSELSNIDLIEHCLSKY